MGEHSLPGGGLDKTKRQWKKKKSKYLFNEFALAKVFHARFLEAAGKAGLSLPDSAPLKWVVNSKGAGKGPSALKYLARYLYRGVLVENNIVSNQDGNITFKYVESRTGQSRRRTVRGEDFLCLILQQVLPKGFRRARNWLFAWQGQKAALPGSAGFAGPDSSLHLTTQAGLQMPQVSGTHADPDHQPTGLVLRITFKGD